MAQDDVAPDLPVVRSVDVTRLIWGPDGDGLVVNRCEIDLRGLTWSAAREALQIEEEIVRRLDAAMLDRQWSDEGARAAATEQFLLQQEDAWNEEEDNPLAATGLDIGVAAAVVALSAANCVPVMSCRGGPGHLGAYPSVTFRSKAARVPDLLEAAEEANCGLENSEYGGGLILYADDVRDMVTFARALVKRRRSLHRLRQPRSAGTRPRRTKDRIKQLSLF